MRISDWSSDVCSSDLAMLSLIRKKLRGEFNFPRNPQRYFGVSAVYSLENVRYPQVDGSVCGTRPAAGTEAGFTLDCGSGLGAARSEEHTSELQSLMSISYAVI